MKPLRIWSSSKSPLPDESRFSEFGPDGSFAALLLASAPSIHTHLLPSIVVDGNESLNGSAIESGSSGRQEVLLFFQAVIWFVSCTPKSVSDPQPPMPEHMIPQSA
jgi:hypothetical protein